MQITLTLFATGAGFYLLAAGIFGTVLTIDVLRDMRGNWPVLNITQWVVISLYIFGQGWWYGVRWPKYTWLAYRREHDLRRKILLFKYEYERNPLAIVFRQSLKHR
jgi:hypothetical protein